MPMAECSEFIRAKKKVSDTRQQNIDIIGNSVSNTVDMSLLNEVIINNKEKKKN